MYCRGYPPKPSRHAPAARSSLPRTFWAHVLPESGSAQQLDFSEAHQQKHGPVHEAPRGDLTRTRAVLPEASLIYKGKLATLQPLTQRLQASQLPKLQLFQGFRHFFPPWSTAVVVVVVVVVAAVVAAVVIVVVVDAPFVFGTAFPKLSPRCSYPHGLVSSPSASSSSAIALGKRLLSSRCKCGKRSCVCA